MEEASIPCSVSPGCKEQHKCSEQHLQENREHWLALERIHDASLPETWDAFLASDAQVTNSFWITLAEVECQKRDSGVSIAGARNCLNNMMAIFAETKAGAIIQDRTCRAVEQYINKHSNTIAPKEKEAAEWSDVKLILEKGVFGNFMQGKWKCACKRVQLACLILLIVACSCRPGELLVTGRYNAKACLQWRDCIFVLHKPEKPADPVCLTLNIRIQC